MSFLRRPRQQGGSEQESGGPSAQAGSPSRSGVDWEAVAQFVRSVQARNDLTEEHRKSVKTLLKAGDLRPVLFGLTVMDTVALNCSQRVRGLVADKKYMRRLSGLATDKTAAAGAAFQLFVNWSFVYSGEELGTAAASVCQTLKRLAALPPPTQFALDMRELIQQGTTMVGFQPGTDFVSMYIPPSGPVAEAEPALERRSPFRYVAEQMPQQQQQQQPPQQQQQPPQDLMRADDASPSVPAPAVRPGSSPDDRADTKRVEVTRALVRGRVRQMREDASYLRKAERRLAATVAQAEHDSQAGASLEAESSDGWLMSQQCGKWCEEVKSLVTMDLADEAMAQLLEVNDALQAAQARWKATATRAAELPSCTVSQSASAASLPGPDRTASASSNDAWAVPVTLPPPRPQRSIQQQQQQQQQHASLTRAQEQHAVLQWQPPPAHELWHEQQHASDARSAMSAGRQEHSSQHESTPLVDLQSYSGSELAPTTALPAADTSSVASQASSSASLPIPGFAEASGRRGEDRPPRQPLRAGSRTPETSSAKRMIPETLFQSPASSHLSSIPLPASDHGDESQQHLPWALRAALQQQQQQQGQGPQHAMQHPVEDIQPRPEAHLRSSASHATSPAKQIAASLASNLQSSPPAAQALPAHELLKLDSWGSQQQQHMTDEPAAAPQQPPSVMHLPSLDSWASADASSLNAAAAHENRNDALPAPHAQSHTHSIAQSPAPSAEQSRAGSAKQSQAQSRNPSAAPSRSSSMPQHEADIIRVSTPDPDAEPAASRSSLGVLLGDHPLSRWQQQPPSLSLHAKSPTPSAAREPEAGTEDLQMEMMALQRQMSEAHGRQEAELTSQRTQHQQQLAALHVELARGREQAHEARQQDAATISSLRQQAAELAAGQHEQHQRLDNLSVSHAQTLAALHATQHQLGERDREVRHLQEKLQAAQYALRMASNAPIQAPAQPSPPARTTSDLTHELGMVASSNGNAPAAGASQRSGSSRPSSGGDGKTGTAMQAYYRQPALRVRFTPAQFAMLTGKLLQSPGTVMADLRA